MFNPGEFFKSIVSFLTAKSSERNYIKSIIQTVIIELRSS